MKLKRKPLRNIREVYARRRASDAARRGFSRINKKASQPTLRKLTAQLLVLWRKSVGKECPLFCGNVLTPKAQYCHDVALARGGSHQISNIFMGCRTCNKAMRTLSRAEYLQLRELIINNLGEDLWIRVRKWLAGSRY